MVEICFTVFICCCFSAADEIIILLVYAFNVQRNARHIFRMYLVRIPVKIPADVTEALSPFIFRYYIEWTAVSFPNIQTPLEWIVHSACRVYFVLDTEHAAK